jgi:peptidoglycan/xylan/chitin deacetylase (PgdA/CDA1 family)
MLAAFGAGLMTCTVFVPLALFYGLTVRRGPKRPLVALTFDDGPHPESTPALLETLARCGLHATFFCPATQLTAYPQLGEALVAGGHELANHSSTHPWQLALMSRGAAQKELSAAQSVLRLFASKANVRDARFFRPVAGIVSPPLLRAARRLGLTTVTWTARARDGFGRVAPKAALARLRHGLVPGGILMLHDKPGSPAAALVSDLHAEARARGLALVTVTELLRPVQV